MLNSNPPITISDVALIMNIIETNIKPNKTQMQINMAKLLLLESLQSFETRFIFISFSVINNWDQPRKYENCQEKCHIECFAFFSIL